MLRSTIISILSFVDDCNLSNTGEKFETVHDIIRRTKSDAQLCNNLIRASGGSLKLTKCFIQVISFSFSKSGTPEVIKEVPELNVQIIDRHNNQNVNIKPISAHATYRSLGTIQGIDENSKVQFEALAKKAHQHTRELIAARIRPQQVWLHHSLCFIPSIAYPSPACHLSKTNCTNCKYLTSKPCATR